MIKRILVICLIAVILTSCSKETNYNRWEYVNTGDSVNGSKGIKGIDIEANECPLDWSEPIEIIAVVDSDVHADMVSNIISTETGIEYLSFFKDAPIYQIRINVDQFDVDALINDLSIAEKQGIKVVNMSFTMNFYSEKLYEFMKESEMLFVCSAGNEHNNLISYPASFGLENVISVIGMDNWGYCSRFSNYSQSADVAAPGENILCIDDEMNYSYQSGTSYAAPFVTASCAYIISVKKTSAKETKQIIINNCKNLDSLEGYVCEGRLLSINNIIENIS